MISELMSSALQGIPIVITLILSGLIVFIFNKRLTRVEGQCLKQSEFIRTQLSEQADMSRKKFDLYTCAKQNVVSGITLGDVSNTITTDKRIDVVEVDDDRILVSGDEEEDEYDYETDSDEVDDESDEETDEETTSEGVEYFRTVNDADGTLIDNTPKYDMKLSIVKLDDDGNDVADVTEVAGVVDMIEVTDVGEVVDMIEVSEVDGVGEVVHLEKEGGVGTNQPVTDFNILDGVQSQTTLYSKNKLLKMKKEELTDIYNKFSPNTEVPKTRTMIMDAILQFLDDGNEINLGP